MLLDVWTSNRNDMTTTTMWTVYNEIDDCVYEGTPIFSSRRDAILWFHKNDGRPSSYVVKISIKSKEGYPVALDLKCNNSKIPD